MEMQVDTMEQEKSAVDPIVHLPIDCEADVDAIIAKLTDARHGKPGKPIQLDETEIRYLCLKSRQIILEQPVLLELSAPIKVCGKCGVSFRRHSRAVF